MNAIQKILVGLCGSLVFVVVVVGSLIIATSNTLTDKSHLKDTLSQESVRKAIVRAIIEEPFQDTKLAGGAKTQGVAINQQTVKKIVKRILTPQNYQQNISAAVDGVYDWLEGNTKKPQLEIKLASNAAEFQRFITSTIATQYNSLPTCQTAPTATTEINPLDAKCKLAAFTGTELAKQIMSEAKKNQDYGDIFRTASISSKDMLGSIDKDLTTRVQDGYRWLKLAPWLAYAALALLLGLIMLVVHQKQRSFKSAGLALLPPAVMVVLGGLATWLLGNQLQKSLVPDIGGSAAIGAILQKLVPDIINKFNGQILLFGSACLIISLLLLFGQKFLNRSLKPPAAAPKPTR